VCILCCSRRTKSHIKQQHHIHHIHHSHARTTAGSTQSRPRPSRRRPGRPGSICPVFVFTRGVVVIVYVMRPPETVQKVEPSFLLFLLCRVREQTERARALYGVAALSLAAATATHLPRPTPRLNGIKTNSRQSHCCSHLLETRNGPRPCFDACHHFPPAFLQSSYSGSTPMALYACIFAIIRPLRIISSWVSDADNPRDMRWTLAL
jgi:hypothetical protein